MFAQVIYGTRPVLLIAFGVGIGATVIAMLIGVAAAYLGGAWDGVLNLLTDVLLVIPLFPLLIVIGSYLHGAGTVVMIVVITCDRGPTPRASSGPRRCRCATGTSSRRRGSGASARCTSSWSRSSRR